jgi:uncharacterized protein (DUF779 family)
MASKPARETHIDADAPGGVMSGETESPEITAEQIEGIPLYLIPRAIADQIRKKRETIACIDVRQGAGHFFTITVKTSERRIYRRSIARKQAAETGGESDE